MPDEKKKSPTTATNGGVTAEQRAILAQYAASPEIIASSEAQRHEMKEWEPSMIKTVGNAMWNAWLEGGGRPWKGFYDAVHNPEEYYKDDVLENVYEVADLTGISSWDDAELAYNRWKEGDDTLPDFWDAVDMITAVPLVGKAGVGAKAAKGFNIAKSAKTGLSLGDFTKYLATALDIADAGQDLSENIPSDEPIPGNMTIEEMTRQRYAMPTPPAWLTNNKNN